MKNDIQLSKHLTSSSALTLSHSNKLDDLRLTEHFKLSEFTKSATASVRKIDNTPSLVNDHYNVTTIFQAVTR